MWHFDLEKENKGGRHILFYKRNVIIDNCSNFYDFLINRINASVS